MTSVHGSLEVLRDACGGIRLERFGETARLTVDRGADRFEIGKELAVDDLQRLSAALADWRGAPTARTQGDGPLPGSRVDLHNAKDGVLLEWTPPDKPLVRALCSIFPLAWICGWTAAGFAVLPAGKMPVLMWLAGEVVGLWFLVVVLLPPRSERLELGHEDLRYRPGSLPAVGSPALADPLDQRTAPIRGTLALHKPDITDVRLEFVGRRQRLVVAQGSSRFEIGTWLREPEREWLHDLTSEWLTR